MIPEVIFTQMYLKTAHRCNGHELGQTSGDAEGQRPGALQPMGSQRVGHDWATEQPPPPKELVNVSHYTTQ